MRKRPNLIQTVPNPLGPNGYEDHLFIHVTSDLYTIASTSNAYFYNNYWTCHKNI